MKINSFLSDEEVKISKNFSGNGYVIKSINNYSSYEWINKKILLISKNILKEKKIPENFLDNAHKYISIKNTIRSNTEILFCINSIVLFISKWFYYQNKFW